MDKQDPDAILSAYQAEVSKYPEFAPLLNNYAIFLKNVRGDYDATETFYNGPSTPTPNTPTTSVTMASSCCIEANVSGDLTFLTAVIKPPNIKGTLARWPKTIFAGQSTPLTRKDARRSPVFTSLFALLKRPTLPGRRLSESAVFPLSSSKIGNGLRS